MNTLEFIAFLHRLDIRLPVPDEQRRLDAPKGVLTPSLRAELSERKVELLEALGQASVGNLPPQPRPNYRHLCKIRAR